VAFLPDADQDDSSYLITGSDDKTLIIWKASHNGEDFTPIQTSSEHTGAINCISVLRVKADSAKWIIATGAADATIKIWTFENDQLELLQSLKTAPKYFPLCLSLSYLDAESDGFVLAAAGTRDIVQILTAETKSDKLQFQVQATLSGHEGWIRSLSFTKETESPDSDLLLASASQDKYVRIWRIHQGKELPPLAAGNSDPTSDAYLPGKSK
jgi:elongator complex protein 2